MSEMVVGQVTTTEDVTQEMMDDILCAAFEGGISYWCAAAVPHRWPAEARWAHECVSRGEVVFLHLHQGDTWCNADNQDVDFVGLSKSQMITGLQKACKNSGKTLAAFYEGHDANDADSAVQFAVFGELVYG